VKWGRFLIRSSVVIAALTALLMIPLPHRVLVPVVLEPQDAEHVYVTMPGQLQSSVKIGTKVDAGDEIAVLRNIEKERELNELEGRIKQYAVRLDSLEKRSFSDSSVEILIPGVKKRLEELNVQLAQERKELQRLRVRTRTAGTVLEPAHRLPSKNDSQFDQWTENPLASQNRDCYLEEGVELCLIGNPSKHEAILAIDQSDIEFITTGQTVQLRLDTLASDTIEGEIIELSEMNIDEVSTALLLHPDLPTIRTESGNLEPLSTTYQARVAIKSSDTLLSGNAGRAKITAEPLSLGRRLHRYLSRTFRFEL